MCNNCADPVVQVRMTADHYALVSDSRTASFADRTAVPAAAVQPGSFMWTPHAFKTVAEPELVTKVDTVSGNGIINPFTLEGMHQSLNMHLQCCLKRCHCT